MSEVLWAAKAVDYLTYLPECLQGREVFRGLAAGMNSGLADYKAVLRQTANEAFVATASTKMVRRWEKILGIGEKNIDLQIRKNKVLSRLKERTPINEKMISALAADVLGEVVKFEKGLGDNWVIIKYRNESPFGDGDFGKAAIIRALPANLKVEVLFAFLEWGEVKTKLWQNIQGRTWKDVMLFKI